MRGRMGEVHLLLLVKAISGHYLCVDFTHLCSFIYRVNCKKWNLWIKRYTNLTLSNYFQKKNVLTLSLLTVMSESACLQWCHQDHLWSLLPCEVRTDRSVMCVIYERCWIVLVPTVPQGPLTLVLILTSLKSPQRKEKMVLPPFVCFGVLGFCVFSTFYGNFSGLVFLLSISIVTALGPQCVSYMLIGEWSVTQSILRVSGEEIFLHNRSGIQSER